jgi:putative (di)nucleoside polyphosphate hydrolase
MPKPYRQNASIIARQGNRYLLVKKPRLHHAWQFPQGGVEAGESPLEAAKREFLEEVGIDKIKILGDERAIYQYNWPRNIEVSEKLKSYRGQTVHIYLADFLADDLDIELDKSELSDWCWVKIEDLGKLIESPKYLRAVLAVIQNATD